MARSKLSVHGRFWAKVAPPDENGCRLWTANKRNGYGTFWNGERAVEAHCWAYEEAYGPVEPGLVFDHYRMNPGPRQAPCSRACVVHVEAVTLLENVLRSGNALAQNMQKTTCHRGHPLRLKKPKPGRFGKRECYTCKLEWNIPYMRKRRERLRAEAGVER